MITAVVLAAGRSERMGRPKMLLPFGRRTLIETVVAGVLKSRFDDVVVVPGAHREAIGPVVSKLGLRGVFNEDFDAGMLSSVVRGLSEVPAATGAFLVVLGDYPYPPASVIERLISARERTGKGIVLPLHRGRRGHPVLIDLRYRGRPWPLRSVCDSSCATIRMMSSRSRSGRRPFSPISTARSITERCWPRSSGINPVQAPVPALPGPGCQRVDIDAFRRYIRAIPRKGARPWL